MPSFWPFRRKATATATLPDEASASRRLFGRDYSVGVPYALPNDLSEENRLDFQHFALRAALRGNYWAPLRNPMSILDVGTGTGRWAIEMAQQFPNANVIGMDIKEPSADERGATNPALDRRPDNYSFVPGNVLEGLPFADNTFDFVHQRLLFFAIPFDKWPFVISELYRVTRMDGWVEVAEGHERSDPIGPAGSRFYDMLMPAMLKRGIDPRVGVMLGDFLRNGAFVNVKTHTVRLPLGNWGNRVGKLMATDMTALFKSTTPLLLMQGMSEAEVAELHQTSIAEWEQLHSTWPFHLAVGQRVI